ncbi:anhydro-N-acetylmuramic acid kinase [Amnimonas aquatica]|uniref:Anhydro-N-acetylmuramic acid kinase n=1 Tax=Amnimonas aquatica TaxID=2094561 RepID=A0A2P6AV70_9GAMM|nr:anhydro-N-acetylmuramic acid kinase [Amnimonas aquatica]PQA52111.1 anhydro-N-acetylmuramic acid kinase [Amnimonas aquatica]
MTGLYIGIMSGTSVDAIDAVLVDFDTPGTGGPQLLASISHAWPDGLRRELLALGAGGERELDRAGEADRQVAEQFAGTVTALLRQAGLEPRDIRAIGSHGQTVRHRPNLAHPFTLQLGDPNTLAERTGIAVVADFRRRDMAAGGQGAPLVPAFHQALFAHPGEYVAVLNLGGIANITLLPPDGDAAGYDTGPANMLLDGWCQRHTGQAFDRDGAWAASATADAALLERLLAHPYLARTAPKSTGREEFGMDWLDALLQDFDLPPVTVQASLLALTARSVADALDRHADGGKLLLCGGGAHNSALTAALAALLPRWRLASTGDHGLDPSWVEATAFAWLARQTVLGLPGNLPAVTGASGPRVLGGYYPGRTGIRLP